MKIRKGFVSNSSSSSFICDITGSVESGWDASPDDCGMYVCENGHTFLQEFALPVPPSGEDDDYDSYEFPTSRCPICQLKEVRHDDMVAYLLKQRGMTRDQVRAEIIETFTDFESFKEALK